MSGIAAAQAPASAVTAQAPSAAVATPAATAQPAGPADYRGQVVSGGFPVPGATVTATLGATKLATVTDAQGVYTFPAMKDGVYAVEIQLLGFAPLKTEIVVPPKEPQTPAELKLLSLDELRAAAKPVVGAAAAAPQVATLSAGAAEKIAASKPADSKTPDAPKMPDESAAAGAADGMLVNGSVNNAASSQYAQAAAFGNTRNSKGLYTYQLRLNFDNSTFDARAYSVAGSETAKPAYNRVTAGISIGGPIRIPHIVHKGPNFYVEYNWTRNGTASTLPGLMPTVQQRMGNFGGTTIYNPMTGLPYTGNVPISQQAAALLALYPLPNVNSGSTYNYQIPIVSDTHQDTLQVRLDKNITKKDQLSGLFALSSSRASSANNPFNFVDTTDGLGINTNITLSHRFTQRFSSTTTFSFNRNSSRVTPFWQNRQNISGNAGINGNDQTAMNWGPPTLSFSSGISGLSDGISSFNRPRTDGVTEQVQWYRGRHTLTGGFEFRRQEYNYLGQANPRGNFQFTGAATQGTVAGITTKTGGSDFADFLLGVPDGSSIAFGNADKYLRQSVYAAYINDDYRVNPTLSVVYGVRWEYEAPLTELHNRLVNLDVLPNFTNVAPVLASNPKGALTGNGYNTSLVRPTKSRFEPRVGLKWRPLAGSSLVLSAGYGLSSNTSVFQNLTLQMAQQAPLSTSLSVQNSAACPLTLANGFKNCGTSTATLFGIDPNFRVGYLHTWNAGVQRDLPFSLQMNAIYNGSKGTRGMQESLPNTYPYGGANPCPQCPLGFEYITSNGNSTREAGTVILRRRLHNGFTASAQYTYSKSIDDDSSLGGGASVGSQNVAQNWRNLSAERSLSSFDQRHALIASVQYTSGMGRGGGTLLSGWRGVALKEWTVLTTITAGTGTPLTPIYAVVLPGTSYADIMRPNVTGAPVHQATSGGRYLNPAAFAIPAAGQFGNARPNSITGPNKFSMNTDLARVFRIKKDYNLEFHLSATNLLNHVTFSSYNTTLTNVNGVPGSSAFSTTDNPLFGQPPSGAASAPRSIQTTIRMRF